MTERTAEIEREIETARDALGRQLSEAEEKAREVIDWRTHYRRNPFPLLGAAVAVGFVASAVIGGDADAREGQARPVSRPIALSSSSMQTAADRLIESLIATASVKAAEYIEEWIPGFRQEFSRRG